jgi:hypothetical protein
VFYKYQDKFGGVQIIIAMPCRNLTTGLSGTKELKKNKKTHNKIVNSLGLNQNGLVSESLDICGKA